MDLTGFEPRGYRDHQTGLANSAVVTHGEESNHEGVRRMVRVPAVCHGMQVPGEQRGRKDHRMADGLIPHGQPWARNQFGSKLVARILVANENFAPTLLGSGSVCPD